MYEKAVLGAVGALGTTYAAYKLMFPWLALDSKDIAVSEKLMELFTNTLESKMYVIDQFENRVAEQPDKYFLIFNDRLYTYQQVNEEANKVARVVKTWNLQKGDVVAMFMVNEPAFVWTLLGFQKLGVPVSLINNNLTHAPLTHCIKVCNAKAVVCSADAQLLEALSEIRDSISSVPVYAHELNTHDLPPTFLSISERTVSGTSDPIPTSWRSIEPFDHLNYVYTSGTTGLPKPALLTHLKSVALTTILQAHVELCKDDVLYTCLPLYHSSGLFLGLYSVIGAGATMVLSQRFSATHFWKDCRKHKVTGIQYIGELCRYLLLKPPHPRDGDHCIRFAYGNGLRMDIWEQFQARFKIPHIVEFFGATEGPASFVNVHNRVGAVGRLSPYMSWRENYAKMLVKFDLATAQPIRDKNGRCIKVKTGEPGLLVCAFPEFIKSDDFYLGDKQLVEKKLVHDVREKGDVYFNYGDVLYVDKDYFLYFADRIGDTFRWKGENVSTLEVANILTALDFILDANVYGVTVPGNDGRAGMACLVLKNGSTEMEDDMCTAIFRHCAENLPGYARPLFLRVQRSMELTVTLKQKKVELVKEGFDIQKIQDTVYMIDNSVKSYVRLTAPLFRKMVAGTSKL